MRKAGLWALTLSVAGVIFWFSAQSAEESSAVSNAVTGGVFGWLFDLLGLTEGQREVAHELIRSGAHVVLFALLGFSTSLLTRSYQLRRWVMVTVSACSAYAVLDECHQLWRAAGRAFEWMDIVKDVGGVLLGIGAVALLCRLVVRQKQWVTANSNDVNHPKEGM